MVSLNPDTVQVCAYIRIIFPSVWSSLFTVKMAAWGTFVSFSMVILRKERGVFVTNH